MNQEFQIVHADDSESAPRKRLDGRASSRVSAVLQFMKQEGCEIEDLVQLVPHLVQYSKNGGGYSPSQKSSKILPPGAYNISYLREALTFLPFHLEVDDIIRLPDTKSEKILKEIEHFWTLEQKFKDNGFVHKRGYLLHGPPGSGKTATVQVIIADTIKDGGAVFMCDNPIALIDGLQAFREIEPKRKALVIFEDIDDIISRHGEANVLSVLDGEKQVGHIVFVATTNYPENLAGRIKNRPSRFDRVEKIDVPNAAARRVFLTHKLKSVDKEEIEKWVKKTDGLSIAHLKELIINVVCLENDLDSQIARLKNMSKDVSSSDGKKKMGFESYPSDYDDDDE